MTATPATVVNFAQLADKYKESLIKDIHDGTLFADIQVSPTIRKMLAPRLKKAHPDRARELEAIVSRTGHLYPKDFWDLSLVACWLGGTVGNYAKHIRDFYGDVPTRDIGLLCSEGRFTVPLEDNVSAGVLEVSSHFFEFIPEPEIESKSPTVLLAHELEIGKNYFILLTTSSGLYRYDIGDVLRCVGFQGQAPILEFLHKGSRCSDMEGEKVTEYHIVKAVTDVSTSLGISIQGFTAVPVRPAPSASQQMPYYAIMVEEQDIPTRETALSFLAGVDRWLCEKNVMYQGKRDDAYLAPPRLVRIPKGSWDRYDRAEVKRRGVGEDHYKHPCLVLDQAFLQQFNQLEEIVSPGK